jgi:hypothetical protein
MNQEAKIRIEFVNRIIADDTHFNIQYPSRKVIADTMSSIGILCTHKDLDVRNEGLDLLFRITKKLEKMG